MYEKLRAPRRRESISKRLDRFLTGTGEVVEVEVEAFHPEADTLLKHKLATVVDIDRFDFFLPLLFLFGIFFLRDFAFLSMPGWQAGVLILGLQFALLGDLMRRVNRRSNGRKAVGLTPPFRSSDWFRAVGVYFATLPLAAAAGWVNYRLYLWVYPSFSFAEQAGLRVSSPDGVATLSFNPLLIVNLLLTVVFAPMTEEIWFRGIGLAGFLNRTGSATRAVLWTSIIFGLLHGALKFMLTGVLGFAFAFVRFRTGSLYCCIVMHALHNFLALAVGAYLSS